MCALGARQVAADVIARGRYLESLLRCPGSGPVCKRRHWQKRYNSITPP